MGEKGQTTGATAGARGEKAQAPGNPATSGEAHGKQDSDEAKELLKKALKKISDSTERQSSAGGKLHGG